MDDPLPPGVRSALMEQPAAEEPRALVMSPADVITQEAAEILNPLIKPLAAFEGVARSHRR
ncbi:hypothetical protein LDL08_41400 [Nonomuraea glycinis]|uniref:Uncharacterized protein n=1 Tax=Nonomuraea glycinis TaxID=2047744 RepID=A0A918AES7_9ACTN|nr:hypothetical protein [Nonomuraea glycinis]MCA2182639.1 hypothetical protein [Nonomuraea glycinis]GGP16816.1 hypothetical protein GCM10012278_82090 [Nonomuraea glycinis]